MILRPDHSPVSHRPFPHTSDHHPPACHPSCCAAGALCLTCTLPQSDLLKLVWQGSGPPFALPGSFRQALSHGWGCCQHIALLLLFYIGSTSDDIPSAGRCQVILSVMLEIWNNNRRTISWEHRGMRIISLFPNTQHCKAIAIVWLCSYDKPGEHTCHYFLWGFGKFVCEEFYCIVYLEACNLMHFNRFI